MYIYIYILISLTGLIIGSFLTALVARLHVKTMTRGRSACGACGSTLHARDLIPVLSFIIQKGRCRYCHSRISSSYIFTEIGTAVMLTLIAHKLLVTYGATSAFLIVFLLYGIAFVSLYALSLYDMKHFIIPDSLVSVFIVCGYAARFAEKIIMHTDITILDIGAGFILTAPFLLVWLISRGTWIGFGDIKLAVGMGGMLGIISGISSIVLGVWIGAAVSLLIMFLPRIIPSSFPLGRRGKRLTMKSEVPFGPYLALGTLLAFLYFTDVIGIGLFL